MVFQNPDASLNPTRSVGDAIMRPLSLLGGLGRQEAKERAKELLQAVSLPESYFDRLPHELSGGEKQRVAIARAFAAEPELILCDEPISSLDVSVQGSLMNLLMKLQVEKQTSYVFISHDLSAVQHLSDAIAVVYLGHVMEIGDATGAHAAVPPLHRGAALGHPAGRPGRQAEAHPPRRLGAERHGRALGLPLPPALPALPRRHLRRAGAAVARGRGRPSHLLPHPARRARPAAGRDARLADRGRAPDGHSSSGASASWCSLSSWRRSSSSGRRPVLPGDVATRSWAASPRRGQDRAASPAGPGQARHRAVRDWLGATCAATGAVAEHGHRRCGRWCSSGCATRSCWRRRLRHVRAAGHLPRVSRGAAQEHLGRQLISVGSLAFIGLPEFVSGLILIAIFAIELRGCRRSRRSTRHSASSRRSPI